MQVSRRGNIFDLLGEELYTVKMVLHNKDVLGLLCSSDLKFSW